MGATDWMRGHVHGRGDFWPVQLPFFLLGFGCQRGRSGSGVQVTSAAHQTHHLLGWRQNSEDKDKTVISMGSQTRKVFNRFSISRRKNTQLVKSDVFETCRTHALSTVTQTFRQNARVLNPSVRFTQNRYICVSLHHN